MVTLIHNKQKAARGNTK